MERIRVLLADSDARFVEHVCRFVKNFPDIEIVACESNGNDALRKIRSEELDAVLFDLVLPSLDGLTLLRTVNTFCNAPAMICCTRFYSDVALDALRTNGAAYVIFKPVELHTLHPTIVSCARLHVKMRRVHSALGEVDSPDSKTLMHIRNYIVSLGIPSTLIGCSYLAEAVRLARIDLSLTKNLSRGLYLEISRNMNTTPGRIERSIRTAISAAYENGGLDGYLINCPSNKEFIHFILRTMD